tara:strand:- start:968 stop:1225 length:258 start_codon:yes stop_codon:yes gene_type:complete
MKKTNLRIRNNYIFEEGNDYFLSSISKLDKWKELKENNYDEFKGEEVTVQLKDLMKKYDIYVNVNFYDNNDDTIKNIDFQQGGGG